MPGALQVLWKLLRDRKAEGKIKAIRDMDGVLGLDLLKKEKIKIPEKVKKLIKEREDFRKGRMWKEADEIRDKINNLGFIIEDKEKGVVIKKR